MNHYTNLETSKQLVEWGCNIETTVSCDNLPYNRVGNEYETYPSYDLLWDVCTKYQKEFFGENIEYEDCQAISATANHCFTIAQLLQQGKEKEANEYLLLNTVFNPQNK